MKTSKFLVLVQNESIVPDLRELNVNLVYPLKSFSVGFSRYFDIDEIPDDAFILVNRILDNDSYKIFKKIILNKKIKGVIFDDLGVLDCINDLKIEKIIFKNHQLTNTESLNELLDYVDSAFISTDITEEESLHMLNNSKKDLCIYGFGYVNIMYSKRTLLSNYAKHHGLEFENNIKIHANDKKFITVENEYGTVFYDTPCLYNFNLINHDKVKYVYINTFLLKNEEVLELIKTGKTNLECNDGFLHKKTIYKLKGSD